MRPTRERARDSVRPTGQPTIRKDESHSSAPRDWSAFQDLCDAGHLRCCWRWTFGTSCAPRPILLERLKEPVGRVRPSDVRSDVAGRQTDAAVPRASFRKTGNALESVETGSVQDRCLVGSIHVVCCWHRIHTAAAAAAAAERGTVRTFGTTSSLLSRLRRTRV